MEIIGHFQTSVRKALAEIYPNYEELDGLVVCGSHRPNDIDIDSAIGRLEDARVNDKPVLGICFGWQLMAIEYARNVLDIPDATSEELSEHGTMVVKKLDRLNVGLKGGESYWNNYVVDPEIEGLMALDENLKKLQHYKGVQFHPEYGSSVDNPHPVLVDFLKACKEHDKA